MAKVKNNKAVLQSYVLTAAKYDFSVYEKRILYCLVEIAQCEVQGLEFPKDCRKIDHDLFDFRTISIPCYRILGGEDDKNHKRVKDALLSLTKKVIEYEDEDTWIALNIVAFPNIKKRENNFSFTIHPMIWDCILNFSKGYRKIELKTVKDFISEYSMRFYEILSGQKTPLTYTIDQLKSMFRLENKYKDNNRFISKVIEVPKKELDEKSPYSFDFEVNKKGRKYHSITFYPIEILKNKDVELEGKKLQEQLSPRWILSAQSLQYLKEVYSFSDKEIKQWYSLFEVAEKNIDLLGFLSDKKRYALEAKNSKGYIIASLKEKLGWDKETERTKNKEKDSITYDVSETINKLSTYLVKK